MKTVTAIIAGAAIQLASRLEVRRELTNASATPTKIAAGTPRNKTLRNVKTSPAVKLEVVLHDKLRRSLVIRNRADMKIKRLWISRDYVHGDLGRSDFPKPESQKAWEGQLWFATLKP